MRVTLGDPLAGAPVVDTGLSLSSLLFFLSSSADLASSATAGVSDGEVERFPGAGTSRSEVWLTLVLPGLGSKAGMRAENFRLRTGSSSQALRRPRAAFLKQKE